MQKKFGKLFFRNKQKSLAKAIDEFNYVNITLPIQEMERKKRENDKLIQNKKNGLQ